MDMDQYRSLLEQLRRNKKNVHIELLTTKYKKSYDQLKERLKAMTRVILQNIVLSELMIEQYQAEEKYIQINQAIKNSGILTEVSRAVFIDQDADQVIKLAGQLRTVVHQSARKAEEFNVGKER